MLNDPNTPRVVIYRKYECDIIDLHIEKAIFKSMSDSGIGPKLFYQGNNYRIEEYIEGRQLSIWELRNPYMLELFARTIYEMHTNQNAADAIEAIRPMNRSQLGIDISIDVWGPGSITRIASIRRRLAPETVPDH